MPSRAELRLVARHRVGRPRGWRLPLHPDVFPVAQHKPETHHERWPDRRILDLLGIDLPILQAPMAGSSTPEMAIAVSEAGGLGSLPCALSRPAQVRDAVEMIRKGTVAADQPQLLLPYAGTPRPCALAGMAGAAGALLCRAGARPGSTGPGVEPRALRQRVLRSGRGFPPEVVSFHFGLPDAALLDTGQGDRGQDHILGDDGRGGALAGRVRLRRDHRHGFRGRRPSRHLPVR